MMGKKKFDTCYSLIPRLTVLNTYTYLSLRSTYYKMSSTSKIASTNHSISLEGYTATLSIDISGEDYIFTLKLSNGNDTVSIPIEEPVITSTDPKFDTSNSCLRPEIIFIKATAPTAPTAAATATEAKPSVESKPLSQEEISKHSQFLRNILNETNCAVGIENRVKKATQLFEYLNNNIEYVKQHQHFRETAINKSYDFKKKHPDQTRLVQTVDKFLTTLGESTVIPDGFKSPSSYKTGCAHCIYLGSPVKISMCTNQSSAAKQSDTQSVKQSEKPRRSARIAKKQKVNY